jgi:hypothetical protein
MGVGAYSTQRPPSTSPVACSHASYGQTLMNYFFFHLQTHKRPTLKPDATFEEKFDQIKDQLLQMNPAQRNI